MKALLVILGAAVLALVSLFLLFYAFFGSALPVPSAPPKGTTGVSTPPPVQRGPDIGRGEPNDPCATSRLGESFDFNGVTYTCSGPKPYRWRAQ